MVFHDIVEPRTFLASKLLGGGAASMAANTLLVVSSARATEARLNALLRPSGLCLQRADPHEAVGRTSGGASLSAIIVDTTVTAVDAVDLVRRLSNLREELPILALVERDNAERVLAVIRAGARGCLFLADLESSLVSAVHELLAGGRPYSRDIGRIMFESLRRSRPPSRERRAVKVLTERESVVLQQLARGFEYADIGRVLDVSVNTVRSYVRAIYEKLGVNSRTEAVVVAIRLGLVKGTPFPAGVGR